MLLPALNQVDEEGFDCAMKPPFLKVLGRVWQRHECSMNFFLLIQNLLF